MSNYSTVPIPRSLLGKLLSQVEMTPPSEHNGCRYPAEVSGVDTHGQEILTSAEWAFLRDRTAVTRGR